MFISTITGTWGWNNSEPALSTRSIFATNSATACCRWSTRRGTRLPSMPSCSTRSRECLFHCRFFDNLIDCAIQYILVLLFFLYLSIYKLQSYEQVFESRFLESSDAFYAAESESQFKNLPIVEYINVCLITYYHLNYLNKKLIKRSTYFFAARANSSGRRNRSRATLSRWKSHEETHHRHCRKAHDR